MLPDVQTAAPKLPGEPGEPPLGTEDWTGTLNMQPVVSTMQLA
jgi:hypothetical protein